MRIVTVSLPDSQIRLIEEISSRICASRSELLRVAIKQFLLKELAYAQKLEEEQVVTTNETVLVQKLEKELEKLRIIHFFDYCINCEKKLDILAGKNHRFHKNYEIFELKFCCSCYRKFKDKSFDEFPAYLVNRIKKKVKAYKDYLEKIKKYKEKFSFEK